MVVSLNNRLKADFLPEGLAAAEFAEREKEDSFQAWEVDPMFRCPLVGACLTLAEQKRLLKKTVAGQRARSDFEMHEIFVAACDSENDLSRRLSFLLSNKYRLRIGDFVDCEEADFLEKWKELFRCGELGLAVYLAASRKGLPLAAKKEIFGLLHMSMHGQGASSAKLRSDLARVSERSGKLEKRCAELVNVNRELKKAVRRVGEAWNSARIEAARLRRESNSLSEELSRLKQGSAVPEGCGDSDASLDSPEISRLRREIERLKSRNSRLEDRLEQASRQSGQECRTRLHESSQPLETVCLGEECPAFDLCRKRVLVVGGMTGMAGHYRKSVEERGGRFEYHDGNLKNGAKTLENSFRRADLVLCPVDFNSHAACIAVKRLAKKHNKTVRMLSGSSLTAINRSLQL